MTDTLFTRSITPTRPKRPPKPKLLNPIEAGVKCWLETLPGELTESIFEIVDSLTCRAPRRWVVYPPMVLLPSGSFGEQWWAAFNSPVATRHKDELWRIILGSIAEREGKGELTHLAINAGIPLHKSTEQGSGDDTGKECTDDGDAEENILRSPTGLIMLFGDFGPALQPDHHPSELDLEEAFWVSTKQNGIVQVWAPRYSMFSRGNVKEKARLLDFHDRKNQILESRKMSRDAWEGVTAVDLYAGIGYFVFSYAKMGMERVFGWELNPWSVEGLRRGAIANGWSVKVVQGLEKSTYWDEQIVIFLEDNRKALERLTGLGKGGLGRVNHVNCGLLPTSTGSWETALTILKGDGWLHLHENVGVDDAERRREEIEEVFRGWLRQAKDARGAKVEHVEFVKTFAPGVWHCVFDVYIGGNDV